MASFLIGVVAVLIVLWFTHKFVRANPTGMAKLLQKGGGVVAIVAAFFLALRGGLAVALPLTQTVTTAPAAVPRSQLPVLGPMHRSAA